MSTWDITFNIPTDKAIDVRDTIAEYLQYQENLDDGDGGEIPNPESKTDFIYGKMKDWLRANYRAGKAKGADSARVTAIADADAVDITVA